MDQLLLDGRYRLLATLGSGGMGEVWRARDERIGREVAVKLLSGYYDQEALDRFDREARIAGALASPAIVAVHDFGRTVLNGRSTPYLVMELLQGTPLNALLAHGRPVPAATVHAVGVGVCDALTAAHAQGVVHRDIKPGNVFQGVDGTVKVLDFGIARFVETRTQAPTLTLTGALIGTPQYMSPEQVRGERIDHRSDLYSLGCLLYALVEGRPPFAADSVHAVMLQQLNTTPARPGTSRADLPPWLPELILRLMAKDPADRPQSAAEVRAALTGDATLRDRPPQPPAPSGGRRRLALGLSAGVATAAAAALVAVLWPSSAPTHHATHAGSTGAPPAPSASPSPSVAATTVPDKPEQAGAAPAGAALLSRVRASDPCAVLDLTYPTKFGTSVQHVPHPSAPLTECQVIASNGGANDLSVRFRVNLSADLTAGARVQYSPVSSGGVQMFQGPNSPSDNNCTVYLPYGTTGFGASLQVNRYYPQQNSDQAPWAEACSTAAEYAALINPKVQALAMRPAQPTGRSLIGKDPCHGLDPTALATNGWSTATAYYTGAYACVLPLVKEDTTYRIAVTFKQDAEQTGGSGQSHPITIGHVDGLEFPGTGFCLGSLNFTRQTAQASGDAQLISVDVSPAPASKGSDQLDACPLLETVMTEVTKDLGAG
ncbi:serine/threonine-protein kinase [Kitasatospora sp. NPDC006697]|uniref:serine/threonine-protein kinase n=1 Tax=Kitasatospora sp. NPDC006697 TaxID=3364020 RepID=UPI0036C013FA